MEIFGLPFYRLLFRDKQSGQSSSPGMIKALLKREARTTTALVQLLKLSVQLFTLPKYGVAFLPVLKKQMERVEPSEFVAELLCTLRKEYS